MEPEGSLPHSHIPATCLYPEPDRSNPYPHIPLLEYYPPIYACVFHVVSFLRVSPPKICIHLSSSPIRAAYPAHLILLHLITRTILGEQYRSFSSSLCSCLHYPLNSSFLGSNILLNTLYSNTLSLRSSLNVSD